MIETLEAEVGQRLRERGKPESNGAFFYRKFNSPEGDYSIRKVVEWSKTSRGGVQYELFEPIPTPGACVGNVRAPERRRGRSMIIRLELRDGDGWISSVDVGRLLRCEAGPAVLAMRSRLGFTSTPENTDRQGGRMRYRLTDEQFGALLDLAEEVATVLAYDHAQGWTRTDIVDEDAGRRFGFALRAKGSRRCVSAAVAEPTTASRRSRSARCAKRSINCSAFTPSGFVSLA